MISREEILNLATLARLKLTENEVVALQKDISSILDYVGQVSAVEVGGEKETPLNHNVMREDVPSATLGAREELLKAFPIREGDYNVVRKIIQKDE
jgi:aspartyl-tRNA(Asn)/glutamyl-tRNA(Gln) amidotransferase subunit C